MCTSLKEIEESNVEQTTKAGPAQTKSSGRTGKRRYPIRQRKVPDYLQQYQCKDECNNAENANYFYRLAYGVPTTFREAKYSKNSEMWINAMRKEKNSLTPVPEGKQAVGGRWVYAVKENLDRSETSKTRYVAKGYGQKEGIVYKEFFSS